MISVADKSNSLHSPLYKNLDEPLQADGIHHPLFYRFLFKKSLFKNLLFSILLNDTEVNGEQCLNYRRGI